MLVGFPIKSIPPHHVQLCATLSSYVLPHALLWFQRGPKPHTNIVEFFVLVPLPRPPSNHQVHGLLHGRLASSDLQVKAVLPCWMPCNVSRARPPSRIFLVPAVQQVLTPSLRSHLLWCLHQVCRPLFHPVVIWVPACLSSDKVYCWIDLQVKVYLTRWTPCNAPLLRPRSGTVLAPSGHQGLTPILLVLCNIVSTKDSLQSYHQGLTPILLVLCISVDRLYFHRC